MTRWASSPTISTTGSAICCSKQVSPDSGTTTKTYDSAGNVHTSTDANGHITTYTCDALNRVTRATSVDPSVSNQSYGSSWPYTVTYTYSYDNCFVGKLCGASSVAGTMAWTYTPQGRVASRTEVDTWGNSGTYPLTYGYNAAGQVISLTYPSGAVIQYAYNGNNQVASIGVTVDGVTTPILTNVQYAPFGDVSGWTWGNGATATRAHDADGNVSTISSMGLHQSYVYDNALRVVQMNDLDNGALSWAPPDVKKAAIANAERVLNEPGIDPARAKRIRGWIKVLKRNAARAECPPLLQELALGTARQLCEAGDQTMCQVFQMLGGEIDAPGT